MACVLVTGANRGIGLEFVRQYAREGWSVHGCVREPETAIDLNALAASHDIRVHRLDVCDVDRVQALGVEIDTPIDVVIANAGVHARAARDLEQIDYGALDDAYTVNVRGLIATARAFTPHLEKTGGRFVGITSLMGSIGDASTGSIGYRVTKAAANMACVMIAAELEARGISAAPFHPGWVRTDMGGPNGLIDVETSASGLRKRIDAMTPTAHPDFLDYAGKRLDW